LWAPAWIKPLTFNPQKQVKTRGCMSIKFRIPYNAGLEPKPLISGTELPTVK
jgi:hypothetical protein